MNAHTDLMVSESTMTPACVGGTREFNE